MADNHYTTPYGLHNLAKGGLQNNLEPPNIRVNISGLTAGSADRPHAPSHPTSWSYLFGK